MSAHPHAIHADILSQWMHQEISLFVSSSTEFRKDTPEAHIFLEKLSKYADSAQYYDDVDFYFQDAVGDSCVGSWVKEEATVEKLHSLVAHPERIRIIQKDRQDAFSAFRDSILEYLLGSLSEELTEAFLRDFGVSVEEEKIAILEGGGILVA